jgi:hypothetical protein
MSTLELSIQQSVLRVSLVEVNGQAVVITANNPGQLVEITSGTQGQLVIAEIGPQGAKGTDGQGVSGTFQFTVGSAGAQTIVLPNNVSVGILYVNGVLQAPSYYTVTSGQLSIPAQMGLQPNDLILFVY